MNAAQLLRSIHSRAEHRGIITADHWLHDLTVCLDGRCPSGVLDGVTKRQWNAWLKAASQKPTYQAGSIGEFCKAQDGNALPPHTIATFPAIITTTTQDRDGDILESKGAQPDPLMPLLWQHIPDMPIGRLLGKAKVQSAKVTGRFTLANTPLGTDAALLAEHGALRISHGFLPLKWEPLDDGAGFHILEFKILETSLVSVPSNPDAVIEAFSREKLHHPLVKAWAGAKFKARPAVAAVGIDLPSEEKGCTCHAKAIKGAVPFKKTPAAPQGEAWEADAAVKGLREWAGVNEDEPSAAAWSKYEQGFGYVDGDGGKLTAYSYPHHEVKDGELVVNFKALSAGIAALNGARGGGSKLSDANRKAVYAHLKKHYEAFPDEDVPELKSLDAPQTKGVYVEFENSWDDIRCDLSDALLTFLMAQGIAGPADLAFIVDMFPDHAIVCVCVGANAFYGPCDSVYPVSFDDDRCRYYALTWAMGADEEPAWTGEPQRIEITPNIQPAAERAFRAMSEKAFLKPAHVKSIGKAMDHMDGIQNDEDADKAVKGYGSKAYGALKSVHDAHDKGVLSAAHKGKLEKALGHMQDGMDHEEATPAHKKAFKAGHKLVKDVMDDAGGASEASAQAVEAPTTETFEKAAELQTKAAAKLGPSAVRKIKSAAFHFKAVAHHDDAGNEHAELAEKAYQPLQDMLNQPDSDPADDDYQSGRGEPSDAADKAAKLGKSNLDKLNTSIGHGETLAKHKTATPHIKSMAKHAVAHLKAIVKPDDPAGEAGDNGAEGTEGTNGNPPKSFTERCDELLDIAIDSAAKDAGDDLLTLASAGSKAGKLLRRHQAATTQK